MHAYKHVRVHIEIRSPVLTRPPPTPSLWHTHTHCFYDKSVTLGNEFPHGTNLMKIRRELFPPFYSQLSGSNGRWLHQPRSQALVFSWWPRWKRRVFWVHPRAGDLTKSPAVRVILPHWHHQLLHPSFCESVRLCGCFSSEEWLVNEGISCQDVPVFENMLVCDVISMMCQWERENVTVRDDTSPVEAVILWGV